LLYEKGILRRYRGIAKEYYAAAARGACEINKARLKEHFCPQICLPPVAVTRVDTIEPDRIVFTSNQSRLRLLVSNIKARVSKR
jgi:hypothetical protein